MFYRDFLPQRAADSTDAAIRPFALHTVHDTLDIDSRLSSTMNDITTFSHLLDQNPARFGLTPSTFQGALILFAYRLLHIYPLANPPDNVLEDALHLTALGFLTTILFEYGRLHVRGYDLLSNRLRNAISSLMTTIKLKDQPALLWILFAGGIALFGPEDEAWLRPCILSTLSTLRVESWEEGVEIIGRLPWIHAIHDRPGLVLWKAITIKRIK